MNKGQIFTARKYYVEKVLGEAIKVKQDFASIRYGHKGVTDGEFIRIADTLGRAITLDITALTLEEILEAVARVVLAGKVSAPKCIVTDTNELRAIAELFK